MAPWNRDAIRLHLADVRDSVWVDSPARMLAILLGLGLLARTSLIIIIPLLMLILVRNLGIPAQKRFTLGMLAPASIDPRNALLIAGWCTRAPDSIILTHESIFSFRGY
jgi:hypothetical protein